MKSRKASAIIQARIGSTRMPGKVLEKIMGKPILYHVLNRVSKAQLIDKVIVATTVKAQDDPIYTYCLDNDIPVFRGSEDDVLDRYYQCAKQFCLTDIVRLTADCPLHDASVIDKVVYEYFNSDCEYVTNTFEYTYPDGMDVEVFSFKVLEEAWREAQLLSEREHVTPYIRKKEEYKKKNVYSDKKYPVYRLSVDRVEDYNLVTSIYEGIGREYFGVDEVVSFLEQHADLLKLNENYEINEGYKKSLLNDKNVTKS